MFKAIAMSLAWWALEIAAWVFIGYKAAVFGVLMSVYTAAMIAAIFKACLDETVEEE